MAGFTRRYRTLQHRHGTGTCPIESGVLLKLADHECAHGRLPMEGPSCGCFPGQEPPAAVELPRFTRTTATTRTRKAA
jgi:hypothetical protein